MRLPKHVYEAVLAVVIPVILFVILVGLVLNPLSRSDSDGLEPWEWASYDCRQVVNTTPSCVDSLVLTVYNVTGRSVVLYIDDEKVTARLTTEAQVLSYNGYILILPELENKLPQFIIVMGGNCSSLCILHAGCDPGEEQAWNTLLFCRHNAWLCFAAVLSAMFVLLVTSYWVDKKLD